MKITTTLAGAAIAALLAAGCGSAARAPVSTHATASPHTTASPAHRVVTACDRVRATFAPISAMLTENRSTQMATMRGAAPASWSRQLTADGKALPPRQQEYLAALGADLSNMSIEALDGRTSGRDGVAALARSVAFWIAHIKAITRTRAECVRP
jgi:hypothetical protein